MKFSLPTAVTRTAAMTMLKAKKNSPTLLFGAGITLGVGTVVSACRATLKLESVLIDTKSKLDIARTLEHAEYSEKDRSKDLTLIYIQTAAKFTRLYAPAIVLGVASVACLTQSHRIQRQRIAGLTAAYAVLDRSFKEYRQRVTDEFGEKKDRELRFGTDEVTKTVEGKNGKKTVKTKVIGSTGSMYARFFSDNNPNWSPQPEYNVAFLRSQQNFANDRLRTKGHLMLSDVYDSLGMERTPASTQVGWLWNKGNGDQYVDFGIWTDASMSAFLDFATGRENGIWLDFNVDGVIWKEI